jgi:hypothetical protein
MNGKINPTIKSKRLVFSMERDVDLGINNIIAGSSITGAVYVNIDCLKEANSNLLRNGEPGLSEPQALGYLVCVIAHELSHCEQNISLFCTEKGSDTEPKKIFGKLSNIRKGKRIDIDIPTKIEIANELNTIKWLTDHKAEIEREFKGIDISYYIDSSVYLYMNKKLGNPITLADYHTYKSNYQAFINFLGSIMGIRDMNKFIQLCHERDIHDFYVQHDINREYNGKNRINMYWLGDMKTLEESESLCSALIETLLDEVVLRHPFFVSGFVIDENESGYSLAFSMLSLSGMKVYGNEKFPDNISTIFRVVRTIPEWFDDDMKDLLEKPYHVIK